MQHALAILRLSDSTERSAAIAAYGRRCFIADAGLVRVNGDAAGVLWRAGKQYYVEVMNSTREPDGSHKHYWLRVDGYVDVARQSEMIMRMAPGKMTSAQGAVAWTFGFQPHGYMPQQET